MVLSRALCDCEQNQQQRMQQQMRTHARVLVH
eukprot:COSAG06_NODE_4834_length_3921_cov_7.706960_1_plen_31_part_10